MGMGQSIGMSFAHARAVAEVRGQFGGEKATEVWLFDFRLRVGITAIEAQQKMQVSWFSQMMGGAPSRQGRTYSCVLPNVLSWISMSEIHISRAKLLPSNLLVGMLNMTAYYRILNAVIYSQCKGKKPTRLLCSPI